MHKDDIATIQALREAVRELDHSIYDLEHGFDVMAVFSRWQDFGLKGSCHVCKDRERDAGDCALALNGWTCSQGDMAKSFNAMRNISHSDPADRRKPEFRKAFIKALEMRRDAIYHRMDALGIELGWTRGQRDWAVKWIMWSYAASFAVILAKLVGIIGWSWTGVMMPLIAVSFIVAPGPIVSRFVARCR